MNATLDTSGIASRPAFWRKWVSLVLGRQSLTMANFTDRLADVYEDRSAFLLDRPLHSSYFSGSVISFRDLNRLVRRAGNALRALGVGRGDRVVIATANRIEMAFCEFGAQRIGAVPVPLNYMLRVEEIRDLVERSGAKVMLTDRTVFTQNIQHVSKVPSIARWVMVTSQIPPEGFLSFDSLMASVDEMGPAVELSDDEPAIVFFTAGTSGLPKGAVLTSGGLMHSFRRLAMVAGLLPTSKRRLALLVMPLAHTGGHQNLLCLLALATPCLVMGSFEPERILDLIERYRVTWFAGIPTMYKMLLEAGAAKRDLSSISLWGGGGDVFRSDLVQTFRRLSARSVGGIRWSAGFVTGYGLAESSGMITLTPPFATGDGCVGWILPGVSYRLVDGHGEVVPDGEVGELVIRTPGMMRGYLDDDVATARAVRNGWLHTGDLMRKGRFGLLEFVSREKEMIKVGGYSVFPAEVEKVLEEHRAVEQAIVVGLPHATKGELPVAAVALRSGHVLTEEELRAWASTRIAPYRCPRRIVFLEGIPLGFGMKALRRTVRSELIARGVQAEARSDQSRGATVASDAVLSI